MRVRGKGESSSILRLKCIIYLCVFLSQFQRFQTELEDELGDDVQVVSADQQGSLSFLYKFSRPSLYTGRDKYSRNYRVLWSWGRRPGCALQKGDLKLLIFSLHAWYKLVKAVSVVGLACMFWLNSSPCRMVTVLSTPRQNWTKLFRLSKPGLPELLHFKLQSGESCYETCA